MRRRVASVISVLSPGARRRFALVLAGSAAVSLAEAFGMVLIVPLMLLITGADIHQGKMATLTSALGDPSRDTLGIYLAGIVVVAFLLKAAMTATFRWWMLGTIAHEQVTSSTEILRHYVRMPYVNHLQRSPGDLMRTMNDATMIFYSQVVGGAIALATGALSIVTIVIALLVVAPLPTLVVCVYFAAAAALYRRFAKPRVTRLGEELTDLSLRSFEASYSVLGGIKAVKVRGNSETFVEEYADAQTRIAQAQRRTAMFAELPKYLLEVLFVAGVGVTAATVFTTNASNHALSVLAVFVAGGFRVLPSTSGVLGSLNAISVGLPYADLVIAEVAEARAGGVHPSPEHRVVPLPFRHAITFDKVSFRYPTSATDVLHDVDLQIPRGSSIAIVGGSGAGKTTLVDVLLGLHTPSSGQVRVDGIDIATETTRWRANLAMVPQDVYLLDRSLRENVAFGVRADRIDDHLIRQAIEQAQLQDLVDQLPDGLATGVGDRGSRVSGGQRQRIGIARALYSTPSVLVLDEATSSLDNLTERRIAETIDGLRGEITVVVVAHRLSTVRHCDQIVFLADGEVTASGTFTEVQRKSPEFARLVALGSLDAEPGDEPLGTTQGAAG